jgi:hypothetical protein
MDFDRVGRFSVVGAVGVTTLLAAYAATLFYLRSETPNDGLFRLHRFLLTALVATWVVADAQKSGRAHPSFDHGWFVFIALPIYVPYYLISTRRWRRGLAILSGIILLFMLPWIMEWVVWLVETIIWFTHTLVRYAKLLISHVG